MWSAPDGLPGTSFLRFKWLADDGAAFVVMFEPSGMTYSLADGEAMYADVHLGVPGYEDACFQIVNWRGGISMWAAGPVTTRDHDLKELDRLN